MEMMHICLIVGVISMTAISSTTSVYHGETYQYAEDDMQAAKESYENAINSRPLLLQTQLYAEDMQDEQLSNEEIHEQFLERMNWNAPVLHNGIQLVAKQVDTNTISWFSYSMGTQKLMMWGTYDYQNTNIEWQSKFNIYPNENQLLLRGCLGICHEDMNEDQINQIIDAPQACTYQLKHATLPFQIFNSLANNFHYTQFTRSLQANHQIFSDFSPEQLNAKRHILMGDIMEQTVDEYYAYFKQLSFWLDDAVSDEDARKLLQVSQNEKKFNQFKNPCKFLTFDKFKSHENGNILNQHPLLRLWNHEQDTWEILELKNEFMEVDDILSLDEFNDKCETIDQAIIWRPMLKWLYHDAIIVVRKKRTTVADIILKELRWIETGLHLNAQTRSRIGNLNPLIIQRFSQDFSAFIMKHDYFKPTKASYSRLPVCGPLQFGNYGIGAERGLLNTNDQFSNHFTQCLLKSLATTGEQYPPSCR